MRFYNMRRYQQLVFRTTPDSLLEWLDGELEKRGIDCVYTHCILSILQEDSSDAELDECMDARNCQKAYRKLESLYSATKTKHQKWKSYSKQILLTTSIPCFDVGIANREWKSKIAAINCLKSVSDDNTIEELIDEVCLKLKNIRNIIAPDKKEFVKNANKIDKDTPFYIPPSSPTDQVEKYFAAFPPLDTKIEEKEDSSQVMHLNNCYANCIRQNKNTVEDIFINNSFQNSENPKYKLKPSYGSLKSIENIYRPENNKNITLKCRLAQTPNHNPNSLKFTDENGYSVTSFKNPMKCEKKISLTIMNSDGDLNLQKGNEKSCSKIIKPKNASQNFKKYIVNKMNYRFDKESDSKRKSFLNFKTYSNSKKAKNSNESYFSPNKFSVLMDEDIYKIDMNPEECAGNAMVCHPLQSEENMENFELISNPYKKFKVSKNPNVSEGIFFDSTNEKDKVSECASVETSLPYLPAYNCDKEQLHKDSSCIEGAIISEKHAEKRKSDFGNNPFEEIGDIAPCKKLSTRTKYFKCLTKAKKKKNKSKSKMIDLNNRSKFDDTSYANKKYNSDDFIAEDMNVKDPDDSIVKLPDTSKSCMQGKTEHFCASKIHLYLPHLFLHTNKKDNSSSSYFMKMRENINKEDVRSFLKLNSITNNPIFLYENIKMEPSYNIESKALTLSKEVSSNTIDDNSQGSLCFPFNSKRVGEQNFAFPLANISCIIIGNNAYYDFDAFKALNYFSPCEIFTIISVGDSNEVDKFLKSFSIESNINLCPNSDTVILPHKKAISENYSCFDCNISNSLPLMKYSNSHLQSVFSTKGQCTSIFSIDFQPEEFKAENFHNNESAKDPFSFTNTQQKRIEYQNNIPAIFGNWNYNLFLDFNHESSNLSDNVSKYDHLNTESFFAASDLSDKKMPFSFPSRLKNINYDQSHLKTNQFCDKKFIWNVDDKDVFSSHMSSSFLYKSNNFGKAYFTYTEENHPKNKFLCLIENTDSTVNLNGMSCFSSFSAFRRVQKEKFLSVNHCSIRCRQNLLKKVTNIDRIIQRINAQNRVVSFSNAHTSLTLPCDNRTRAFLRFLDSQCISYSNDIKLDNFTSFNSCIAENGLSSDFNLVNLNWPKQCTNSDDNLRAIWENKDNPDNVKENNSKPAVKENTYTLYDTFDLESLQNDLKKEQAELLKSMYSISDLSDEINEQIILDSVFKNSCKVNANSKNNGLEINVEELPRISLPLHDAMSTNTTTKNSQFSSFDFSDPLSDVESVDIFSLEKCINTIDSKVNVSDANYSVDMKEKTYWDSIDVNAFRGPYGSYNENKANYSEGGGWSLDSDDFMFGSDALHNHSSSLHELETTGIENESFQHAHFDQQQFSSKDTETTQLNTTRSPFVNSRRRLKHKCPTSRRPCAFFMEGNCSRNDCKFSHDLSNITCRFWIEDSCFKGSTCPFLHGYAEHQMINHHSSVKNEPKHNYSLDSEADFPSLSSAKCEKILTVKSSPVDIVHAKGFKNSRLTNH